jgi:hypothetical protein
MPTLYETLQSRGRALTEAVREAERETDMDRVDDLLRQKNELNRMMRDCISVNVGDDTDKTAA